MTDNAARSGGNENKIVPRRKPLTPEQQKRREQVDRRNRAIQSIKLPEPKWKAFGGRPKS